jgi:hypothetical protein
LHVVGAVAEAEGEVADEVLTTALLGQRLKSRASAVDLLGVDMDGPALRWGRSRRFDTRIRAHLAEHRLARCRKPARKEAQVAPAEAVPFGSMISGVVHRYPSWPRPVDLPENDLEDLERQVGDANACYY